MNFRVNTAMKATKYNRTAQIPTEVHYNKPMNANKKIWKKNFYMKSRSSDRSCSDILDKNYNGTERYEVWLTQATQNDTEIKR